MSFKPCKDCGEVKPLDEFTNNVRSKDGKQHFCKECGLARKRAWRAANPEKEAAQGRRAQLKSNYGITVEQYDEMYEAQDGCCAICGNPEQGAKRFHVDHDHETGEVRALLCHLCNVGIGHFRDDPELLQAAIEYLEVHNERKLDAS